MKIITNKTFIAPYYRNVYKQQNKSLNIVLAYYQLCWCNVCIVV
jgi:hypothetical protein